MKKSTFTPTTEERKQIISLLLKVLNHLPSGLGEKKDSVQFIYKENPV